MKEAHKQLLEILFNLLHHMDEIFLTEKEVDLLVEHFGEDWKEKLGMEEMIPTN